MNRTRRQSRGASARPGTARAGSALALSFVLLGCDRPAAAPVVRPTVPPGPGVLTGIVRYSGPPVVVTPPEGDCCPGVPRPADESVIVNPDGTLANVTVYVEGGPNVAGPPPAKAVLSQRGCRYVPHVLALRVGQPLVVTNGDPTPHNVHVTSADPLNPELNVGQVPAASQAMTFVAVDPDVIFKCDVHAWMRAHAMVFDHPCYAVTGADGAFRIDRLPPGTYTLVAHHERFGDQQQTVTVTADRPMVAVTFDYHP